MSFLDRDVNQMSTAQQIEKISRRISDRRLSLFDFALSTAERNAINEENESESEDQFLGAEKRKCVRLLLKYTI